jgi:lauroyl/myristoyl acyltransferase
MLSWEKRDHWIQTVDFRFLLPAMARLPLRLGQQMSALRGILMARTDYDWRSMALRFRYIRERTRQAMQMIDPDAGEAVWRRKTRMRFVHNSREEWQAALFGLPVMETINRRSVVEGIERMLSVQSSGQGIVMVGCHFDSFCMGMVLMGMKGLKVNVINTKAIEDSRIHPAVRMFFHRKYRNMEARMNGLMEYHETNLPFFYQALEKGETVALMGDVPGSKTSVILPFLGTRFRMPVGAWHMAKKTNSLVGGFLCLHEGVGRYRVICLPPKPVHPDSPLETLLPVYAFLEEWIRKMPERWVSSDLLPAYSG